MAAPAATTPRHSWRAGLLVLPAVLAVLAVAGTALVSVVLQSLGLMPLVGEPRASADAYSAVGDDLWRSTWLTLAIAGAATAIAAVVGVGVAVTTLSGRRAALLAATLTVPVPHLIGAATMGLLLADSGVLPRVLGLTDGQWPALVGGRWWIAVIAEYAWKESAFVALVVAGTLATQVTRFDDTAATLGAGRWARLRLVTLPLITPSVIAAAAITFAYTVGSYEVARLLGRAYPEPLAVLAVRLFRSIDLAARPEAAAVAVITSTVALLSLLVATRALRATAAWR